MQTIEVQYNESVEVSEDFDGDGDLRIELFDADGDEVAGVYATRDQVREIRDALSDALAEDNDGEAVSLPAGAVRASDISLNEALIRVAAAHETHVTFRYAKSDTSPIEVRTFVPRSVKSMGDHVTFVGDDDDRGAIRSFRSDRIKGTVQVVA